MAKKAKQPKKDPNTQRTEEDLMADRASPIDNGPPKDADKQALAKIDPKKVPADQAKSVKPHKGADGNDFKKMQDGWAKEKVELAQANLLNLFETDDDLPLSKHLLLVGIVSFFAVFFLWANIATIDEIARGDGKIIPSSENQVVQTLYAGTVEEFLVREGEVVQEGQVLMRLSDIEASSDLGANQARYMGLLAAITRLQAEAEGRSSVDFPEQVMKAVPQSVTEELNTFRANQLQLSNQTSVLQQQLAQRQQEVRGAQTRVSDIQSNLSLIQDEKAMIAPLVERGTAPRMELIQLDQRINQSRTELNQAQSALRQARGAVGEVQARINEIKSSARAQAQAELSVKLIEVNELKEKGTALQDRKVRTELTSPVHGIVQDISVTSIGQVVKPGDNIITIVPKDDLLVVEARIKPSDRAHVNVGQKAVVKITAYDFSIYGGLKGKVDYISADTVQDDKGNYFYNIRVVTEDSQIKRKGQVLPIETGMVTSVDIITGEKTVMQYLLKPFIKTLDVAFTER